MQELKAKDVLTTGEVAKICNVAPRTVSKWFDSGSLKGYRIPGSKDRRIPLNQLIRFMKEHSIPLNGLKTGRTRVVIVDRDGDMVDVIEKILESEAGHEVEIAAGPFQAGVLAERIKPHAMLIDIDLQGMEARTMLDQIRANPELQLTRLIAMSAKLSEGEGQALMHRGWDGFLRKPFHVRQVMSAIEQVTQVNR